MLGSLKNSIMPHVLPFFRLQWASLCSRDHSRPNLDERKGAKYPYLGKASSSSSTSLDAEYRLTIHLGQVVLENCPGHVDGGEHVGDQADGEGDREAANRSGAEQEQEKRDRKSTRLNSSHD